MKINWVEKSSVMKAYQKAADNLSSRFTNEGRGELSLLNAAEPLRDDEEVAAAAIAFDAENFAHLSDRLRDNPDLLLKATEGMGFVFAHASQRLRYDREIILKIAKINGCLLTEKAPNDMFDWKNDKEIVLAAINSADGGIVEHLTLEFQDDADVMLAAAGDRWDPLQHASTRLQADKDFALKALSRAPQQLCFFSEELKCDPDVVRVALDEAGDSFPWSYVGNKLKKDRAFIAGLLEQVPDLFWNFDGGMKWGCKSAKQYVNKFKKNESLS
jgi:hypothetical protein